MSLPQVMHVFGEVAALKVEAVPAGQGLHKSVPFLTLYVPPGQAEHGPASGPEYPFLHVHEMLFTLASGEVDPAGHAIQDAEP